jgi:hypothetical protein
MVAVLGLLARGRPIAAAFSLVAGASLKVYPAATILLGALTRQRRRLAVGLVLAAVIVGLSPMLVAPPGFVVESYGNWVRRVSQRSVETMTLHEFQDQSVPGLVRRFTGRADLPSLPLMVVGGVLLLLPYLRLARSAAGRDGRTLPNPLAVTDADLEHHPPRFALLALGTVMMYVVLFSSAAENPTYVVFQSGAAAWFCASRIPLRGRLTLLFTLLLFSSLSSSDLYPDSLGNFWTRYSLRAIPSALIWLVALVEMATCPLDPAKAESQPAGDAA